MRADPSVTTADALWLAPLSTPTKPCISAVPRLIIVAKFRSKVGLFATAPAGLWGRISSKVDDVGDATGPADPPRNGGSIRLSYGFDGHRRKTKPSRGPSPLPMARRMLLR